MNAVFGFIAFAMATVVITIGGFGPRTRGLALEFIRIRTGTCSAPQMFGRLGRSCHISASPVPLCGAAAAVGERTLASLR